MWPPDLRDLFLYLPTNPKVADASAIAALQHMQLVCLQDAVKLEHLELHTGAVCHWPASLQCTLPASLQVVNVCIHAEYLGQEEGMIDLSMFTEGAGCPAELQVEVWVLDNEDAASILGHLIRAVSAISGVCSLTLLCMPTALEQLSMVEQVQCDELTLSFWVPECEAITWLPPVPHLNVLFESMTDGDVDFQVFMWSALASPGLRCLGSEDHPMNDIVVKSCTGLPVHDHASPWALAIWADLSTVRGLPLGCFREEARGKHVWRNAAARDLEL